ncbi:hypothetical protein NGRA_2549 [Nosema granulosis]|uniref:Uncharacterized protein n=1 Tax=Nosema granulosis TaxID=83296 RepID=A0A9P6GZN0_9MICR|nr:hypothetical protein NGRA_2549 [Nosema granulosis]
MNKYTGYISKLLLFLIVESGIIIQKEIYTTPILILCGATAIYHVLVMIYFFVRSEQYRTTFLRKTYKPSTRLLFFLFFIEFASLIAFYLMVREYIWFILILVFILIIVDFLLFYQHSSRKTVQLEKNEEFFKICFLQQDYREENVLCLRRGELVQVVDKKGDKIEVRRSDGKKFLIPQDIVDDKLDLYL